MHVDKVGQQILSEQDLCNLYMSDPTRIIKYAVVDKQIPFSENLDIENVPALTLYKPVELSIEDFDQQNQDSWKMPQSYKEFDILQFVLDQCNTEAELQRVGEELLEFQKRDMFMLLRYLKYLVDTMRENNIIWGVGRGSSVASFVLFLLGVHRINSLYYDLSIDEFLK
jgi:DNA polymerase III alpha subunit